MRRCASNVPLRAQRQSTMSSPRIRRIIPTKPAPHSLAFVADLKLAQGATSPLHRLAAMLGDDEVRRLLITLDTNVLDQKPLDELRAAINVPYELAGSPSANASAARSSSWASTARSSRPVSGASQCGGSVVTCFSSGAFSDPVGGCIAAGVHRNARRIRTRASTRLVYSVIAS